MKRIIVALVLTATPAVAQDPFFGFQRQNEINGIMLQRQTEALTQDTYRRQQQMQQSMPFNRPNCVGGWVVGTYGQMC
jgi:hypothetical protein